MLESFSLAPFPNFDEILTARHNPRFSPVTRIMNSCSHFVADRGVDVLPFVVLIPRPSPAAFHHQPTNHIDGVEMLNSSSIKEQRAKFTKRTKTSRTRLGPPALISDHLCTSFDPNLAESSSPQYIYFHAFELWKGANRSCLAARCRAADRAGAHQAAPRTQPRHAARRRAARRARVHQAVLHHRRRRRSDRGFPREAAADLPR